jgi:hypothetical protein
LLSFRRMRAEDQERMTECLSKMKTRMLESTYSTYFLWDEKYQYEIDFSDDFLFVRYTDDGKKGYLIPAGEGNFISAMDKLIEYSEANEEYLHLGYIPESYVEVLEKAYPGQFEFTEDRDSAEYLYLAEKMITLSGKKLHSKRNFINRFKRENEGRWKFEHIGPENLDAVLAYDRQWYRDNRSSEGDLESERIVIRKMLMNMGTLGAVGGLLRLDGRIIGISLGTEITEDTFDIQIEKAEWDIPGAYQMLAREFAEEFCSGYTYINREEDMGVEGLRKAKLSYYPYKIMMKYVGVRKNAGSPSKN